MRVTNKAGQAFGILCGSLIGWAAPAQEIKPAVQETVKPAVAERPRTGVFRMEIQSGPNRTVHYFSESGSPGELSALRDLERSENELSYVDNLQALRRQYITNEQGLD